MFCFSHHKTLKMDSYEGTRHNSKFMEDLLNNQISFSLKFQMKGNQIFVTIVMQSFFVSV